MFAAFSEYLAFNYGFETVLNMVEGRFGELQTAYQNDANDDEDTNPVEDMLGSVAVGAARAFLGFVRRHHHQGQM